MRRRQALGAIGAILAAAVAPAFVAKGLMAVKPIVVPDFECFTSDTLRRAMDKMNGYGINGPYTCVVHPDMLKQLQEATVDIDYIAGISGNFLGVDIIEAQTNNGYIKPVWENDHEV